MLHPCFLSPCTTPQHHTASTTSITCWRGSLPSCFPLSLTKASKRIHSYFPLPPPPPGAGGGAVGGGGGDGGGRGGGGGGGPPPRFPPFSPKPKNPKIFYFSRPPPPPPYPICRARRARLQMSWLPRWRQRPRSRRREGRRSRRLLLQSEERCDERRTSTGTGSWNTGVVTSGGAQQWPNHRGPNQLIAAAGAASHRSQPA
jgi:hypothetical protein